MPEFYQNAGSLAIALVTSVLGDGSWRKLARLITPPSSRPPDRSDADRQTDARRDPMKLLAFAAPCVPE